MVAQSSSVVLSPRMRKVLEAWVRSGLTAQRVVERARIILMSAAGQTNQDQARELGVDRQRVRRWRRRWAAASDALGVLESCEVADSDFEARLLALLADDARSGAPPKFSAEQMAAIIALACERPGDCGLPVSHWTPAELAREAIKRGIVESISPRQVDRFLAKRTSGRTGVGTG